MIRLKITPKQAIKNLEAQFAEYMKGERKKFELAKIGVHGDLREFKGTDLQKSVWRELINIPYGKVISYEELAKRVGKPKAIRAVASAVGDNPLCIVIPCHRVLPKKSITQIAHKARASVGGYALGFDIKEALLQLEGVI